MNLLIALIHLTRLNKPIGIYLLWFPTAWALTLAYGTTPPLFILLWFAAGTVVMRSAGCIINDIADRRWDGMVQRTSLRPLAQQALSLPKAWLALITLLGIALFILIQLPKNCFYGALPAVLLTFIYPFCKRFLGTPQLVLGLAFSSSIPMVALAADQSWTLDWSLLWIMSVLSIIAYDTQYALCDIEDDQKLGIRSSAIFFKTKVYILIISLQCGSHSLWLFIAPLSTRFFFFWTLALIFGFYQAYLLKIHQPLRAFKNNAWYGLWMWCAYYASLY